MLINNFISSEIDEILLREIIAEKSNTVDAVINLSGSDFKRMTLPSMELIGDSLRDVNFSGCQVENNDTRVVLTGSDLTNSLFVDSKIASTNLKATILDSVDFSLALMDFALFEAAKGGHIVFRKTRLLAAMFSGVVMPNADFTEAVLNGTVFDENSDLESVGFPHATMNYVHMENVAAAYSDFEGVNAFKLIVRNSQMSQSSFNGAQLIGSKFLEVKMIGTTFCNAKLTEVDFRGSNLTDVDFSGCILEKCLFDDAILQDTLFGDAILIDTDTSGENFKAAKWESTKKA